MQSIHTLLGQFDLTPAEITVYLLLQQHAELTVPRMVELTKLSRATLYDAIQSLSKSALIEQRKDGRIAYYRSTNPQKLAELITKKRQATDMLVEEMKQTISQLSGSYNTLFGKPGFRYFEGEDGMREALFDSLKAKDTIYTFANSQMITAFAPEMNEEYMKQRIQKKIQKRIIFTDTPESRELAAAVNPEFTQYRFLNAEKYPFATPVEIYNDSVSFHVLHSAYPVAMLIQHEHIAQMHKSLFEFIWNSLTKHGTDE